MDNNVASLFEKRSSPHERSSEVGERELETVVAAEAVVSYCLFDRWAIEHTVNGQSEGPSTG